MTKVYNVVMALASNVRSTGVAVATVVDAICNLCNINGVQLIAGTDNIAYKNNGWLVTDEYHFVIDGKHITVGCPFYLSATGDIHMFNKYIVVCSDSNRVVCVNHITNIDTIYRD